MDKICVLLCQNISNYSWLGDDHFIEVKCNKISQIGTLSSNYMCKFTVNKGTNYLEFDNCPLNRRWPFDSGLLAEFNQAKFNQWLNSISNKKIDKKKKNKETKDGSTKQSKNKRNQNSCPLDLKKITLIPVLHYPLKHFLYASR